MDYIPLLIMQFFGMEGVSYIRNIWLYPLRCIISCCWVPGKKTVFIYFYAFISSPSHNPYLPILLILLSPFILNSSNVLVFTRLTPPPSQTHTHLLMMFNIIFQKPKILVVLCVIYSYYALVTYLVSMPVIISIIYCLVLMVGWIIIHVPRYIICLYP